MCDPCLLEGQIPPFATPGALDCGRIIPEMFGGDDDPLVVQTCVEAALADATDFVVRQQLLGIDSRIERSWLGVDGRILELEYDSHPCGGDAGPVECCPRVELSECVEPSVPPLSDGGPLIRCVENLDRRQVCAGFL